MRMKNAAGRAIYINAVEKRGKVVFVIKAIPRQEADAEPDIRPGTPGMGLGGTQRI